MGIPIEVPLGYGHGGDVIFEDVVTGAEDVVGDVLVPVDLADVEVESALIDGRQFLAQIDRILADEAPLTQHVEAQTGDGPIGFIVEPHLPYHHHHHYPHPIQHTIIKE